MPTDIKAYIMNFRDWLRTGAGDAVTWAKRADG